MAARQQILELGAGKSGEGKLARLRSPSLPGPPSRCSGAQMRSVVLKGVVAQLTTLHQCAQNHAIQIVYSTASIRRTVPLKLENDGGAVTAIANTCSGASRIPVGRGSIGPRQTVPLLALHLLLFSVFVIFPVRAGAAESNRLEAGQALRIGQSLRSANSDYRLTLQGDGNLVLYFRDGRAIWASNTVGRGPDRLVMQGDGNLVMYKGRVAVWASNTVGAGVSNLKVQDDGNLVVYRGSKAVWASNTAGFPRVRVVIAGSVRCTTSPLNNPVSDFRIGAPSAKKTVTYRYDGRDGGRSTEAYQLWFDAPRNSKVHVEWSLVCLAANYPSVNSGRKTIETTDKDKTLQVHLCSSGECRNPTFDDLAGGTLAAILLPPLTPEAYVTDAILQALFRLYPAAARGVEVGMNAFEVFAKGWGADPKPTFYVDYGVYPVPICLYPRPGYNKPYCTYK